MSKSINDLRKRVLAALTALVLCLGMMSGVAMAEERGHSHNSDGWSCTEETQLICTKTEHKHAGTCTGLICTSDQEDHKHVGTCYGVVCQKETHSHEDGCWETKWDCSFSEPPEQPAPDKPEPPEQPEDHYHIWRGKVEVIDPTCTEAGKEVQLCAICGAEIETIVKNEELPALGHEWDDGEVTKEATVDEEGVMTFTCVRGCTRTEEIPKLTPPDPEQPDPDKPEPPEDCTTHIWRGKVRTVEPTCTEAGKVIQLCAICGVEIKTVVNNEELPALGHEWDDGKMTKEATVDEEGVMTFTCVRGCTKEEAIPKLDPDQPDSADPTPPSPPSGGGSSGGSSRPRPMPTPVDPDPVEIEDPDVPLVELPEEVTEIEDEDVPLTELPEEVTEIEDEDVPLTELPEDLTEIEDEDVPLDETPRTGDSSHTAIWAGMCAISLAGAVALNRKKEDEEA